MNPTRHERLRITVFSSSLPLGSKLAAALLLLAGICSASAAMAGSPPSDISLKSFLQDYLRDDPPDDEPSRFATETISLDERTPMELVYLSGPKWCGSGGCTALLIKEELTSFKVVQKFTLVRPPIRVLCSQTHGWHDLSMWVSGGGLAGKNVVLRSNGSVYPSNPSLAPDISEAELAGCGYDVFTEVESEDL